MTNSSPAGHTFEEMGFNEAQLNFMIDLISNCEAHVTVLTDALDLLRQSMGNDSERYMRTASAFMVAQNIRTWLYKGRLEALQILEKPKDAEPHQQPAVLH
jgi:hypothetical protein